jgi:hypothetical protein
MGDAKKGLDLGALAREAALSAKRLWPAVALVLYAGYFDKKVHRNWTGTVLICGIALVPILFHRSLGPIARPWLAKIPAKSRGLIVVGIPAALIYITRWRGQQTQGAAIVTVALPLALGFALTAGRERIDERLAPFYERRNRVLPRAARFGLVLAIPVVLTFAIAQRSLSDIGAIFGGQTKASRPVNQAGGRILITALLSTALGFVLLNEPPRGHTNSTYD